MSEGSSVRALIVDDEPLARDAVRLLARRDASVEIAGECATGTEAAERIRAGGIDLVFLDIQMPGMSGFDVVREVGVERMPPVVFVTAHDEHALRAFEAEAVDYLLKPLEDDRFATALARAKRRIAQRDQAQAGRALMGLLARVEPPTPQGEVEDSRWLTLRASGRILRFEQREIDWIESANYVVRVHVSDETHTIRSTLTEVERRLDPARFVRVHRSVIVNVERVRQVEPLQFGDATILMRDGTRLRLARTRRAAFEERFGAIG